MNICLSYVGKLPEYIIDCVYQIQLFTNADIYLILNDINSPHISTITKNNNVKIVNYKDVYSKEFNKCVQNNFTKITVIDYKDREELFLRSIERFFLLQNTMIKYNLFNVFFMELDNLIYNDPNNWLHEFSKNDLCFMIDNIDRYSTGVMYVKSSDSLSEMLQFFIDYINNVNLQVTKDYICEMTLIYRYMELKKKQNVNCNNYDMNDNQNTICQILPTFWKDIHEIDDICINFEKYDSIFDAAALGITLFGVDSYLLNNPDFKKDYSKEKWNPAMVDYTKYAIEWKIDDKNRKIPFIFDNIINKWIRINNLHIHCKNLKLGLSVDM